MASQSFMSNKRERLMSQLVKDRSRRCVSDDRRRRSRRSWLIPKNRRAVPGGITNQMIGIAIAAIVLVVGGSYAGSYLSTAHTSATNNDLSAALTAASSVYDQQDSFAPLPGETSLGASLSVSDPLLKFVKAPLTSSKTNTVVYQEGSGGGTTGQPQSLEFSVPDGNGHCMYALDIESASSTLLTGTPPPGVTQPGTYYAAGPASGGSCTISSEGALPTNAAYPTGGGSITSWLTTPISG